MIRNELFAKDGSVTRAEIIDLNAGTIAFEEHGVITSTRALTADEIDRYTPAEPVMSVDERLDKLEVENAALRKALVKSAVLTDAAIDAEKVAVIAEAAEAVKD
jgi:hypothetical protein